MNAHNKLILGLGILVIAAGIYLVFISLPANKFVGGAKLDLLEEPIHKFTGTAIEISGSSIKMTGEYAQTDEPVATALINNVVLVGVNSGTTITRTTKTLPRNQKGFMTDDQMTISTQTVTLAQLAQDEKSSNIVLNVTSDDNIRGSANFNAKTIEYTIIKR
jgi:hypothetical protein